MYRTMYFSYIGPYVFQITGAICGSLPLVPQCPFHPFIRINRIFSWAHGHSEYRLHFPVSFAIKLVVALWLRLASVMRRNVMRWESKEKQLVRSLGNIPEETMQLHHLPPLTSFSIHCLGQMQTSWTMKSRPHKVEPLKLIVSPQHHRLPL